MKIVTDRAEVSTPGSVTGFGTGLDLVGVAVLPAYRASFRAVVGRTQVIGNSGPTILTDPDKNPAVVAVKALLERVGAPTVGLNVVVSSSIPSGAGLGSYAAKVAAGTLAAKALLGNPEQLDLEFLTQCVTSLGVDPLRARLALAGEGAFLTGSGIPVSFPTPRTELTLTALVPDFVLDEHSGPGPRPATVPFSAAQEAAGNALMVTSVLSGQLEPTKQNLFEATENHMAGEYLQVASPASAALVGWLREQGLAAFASGDGPAVCCFSEISPEVAGAAERSGWRTQLLTIAPVRSNATN